MSFEPPREYAPPPPPPVNNLQISRPEEIGPLRRIAMDRILMDMGVMRQGFAMGSSHVGVHARRVESPNTPEGPLFYRRTPQPIQMRTLPMPFALPLEQQRGRRFPALPPGFVQMYTRRVQIHSYRRVTVERQGIMMHSNGRLTMRGRHDNMRIAPGGIPFYRRIPQPVGTRTLPARTFALPFDPARGRRPSPPPESMLQFENVHINTRRRVSLLDNMRQMEGVRRVRMRSNARSVVRGYPVVHGHPGVQGQPGMHGLPAVSGHPAVQGYPAVLGPPAVHGHPGVQGQPGMHDHPAVRGHPAGQGYPDVLDHRDEFLNSPEDTPFYK